MNVKHLSSTLAVLLALGGAPALAQDGKLPLKTVEDIPLAGRPTRLDYQSLDECDAVHGTIVIPELGRCYASATGKNEIVSIDEKTLKITARIPGGVYPDGMAFDPNTKKLYVSDENGATETVIDTATQKRVA